MTLRFAWGTALLLAAMTAQADLPAGWSVNGPLQADGAWSVAQGPVVITFAPAPQTLTRLDLRLGALRQAASLRVPTGEKKSAELKLSAEDDEYRVGIIGKEIIPLPDSGFQINLFSDGQWLFRDRYYVRPHPHWYEKEDRQELLRRYAQLPPASQHESELTLETRGGSLRLWVDGRCIGALPQAPDTPLTLTLAAGHALRVPPTEAAADARYLPLRLAGYARPGVVRLRQTPAGWNVPFAVAADGEQIDVGRSRWLAEEKGPEEYTDNYYTRSAFDNRPEDILLAVPTDDYSHAHVLCVVDPDPAKAPVLTLRLTRYLKDYYDSGGRGGGIADASLRLEKTGGKWPPGCRELGKVKATTAAGEAELPLLQVAVPLRSGEIADIIDEQGQTMGRSTQCLDLELTKELGYIETANHGAYSTKPIGKPSGVQVYGLTLERAPVQVRLRSRQVGQVFYAAERPALRVEMTNRLAESFRGMLSWQITDPYGKTTTAQRAVTVPLPGDAPFSVPIDLQQPLCGRFTMELALSDSAGRVVWQAPTSFAILPPDTRRAKSESPYGIWWFRGSHGGTKEVAGVAPLLQRMGFRHVNPGRTTAEEVADLAAHGLTISMITDYVRRGDKAFEQLDQAVAISPEVKWAMIFHETGFGEKIVFPPEFLGQPAPQLTPEQEQKFREWCDKAIAYARTCRDKHPHLKLIVGNGSLPFAVEFMRQGFPRELVDAFGDEDLGQQIMPEAPPMAFKSPYWLKEYTKLYKYAVPVTSCYEWRGRGTNPGNLSYLEQAQLYSRDALQGLALGFPHINPGLLHDVGDSYYYSRWGSGGVCERYPLLTPKPSYVALATLTRELDGAQYQRMLPTNSPTLHVMELRRGANSVYALWLPRGEREVTLTFAQDTSFTLTDMHGNARSYRTQGKQARVPCSASPGYLAAVVPVTAASGGATACEPPPAGTRVVDKIDSLARWHVNKEPDPAFDKVHFDFPRQAGPIAGSVVSDGKAKVVQLALAPQPEVPWPVARYVRLQAVEPVPLPGRPSAVGVWVKGNSSWGRVSWELEDAKGEKLASIGAPCGGWSVGDWRCRTFLNFDGWNYLSVALPYKYESGFYGPPQSEWTFTGGDGVVDYPVRVTGLIVELRERVVRLTEPVEVPDKSIRLRDLGASCGAERAGR